MRKWIVEKLFDLALWIEGEHTTLLARMLAAADDFTRAMVGLPPFLATPKKRGRPKGRKDRVGLQNQAAPKKRGRPLGSKNKPKGVNDGTVG